MSNLLSIERVCLFGVIFTGFCNQGRVPNAEDQAQAALEAKARDAADLVRAKVLAEGKTEKEADEAFECELQKETERLQSNKDEALVGSVHPDNEIRAMLQPGSDPRLARIYAMSYEGGYHLLPRPTVFLVHGPGGDPEELVPGGPRFQLQDLTPVRGTTGLPSKPSVFAEDIRVWVYDRDDITVRVEIATGGLDELLLQPLFCPGGVGGSRADLTSRADLNSRADLTSRVDLTSRADLTMRHRFR